MKQILLYGFILLSVSTFAQIQTHIIKPGAIINITLRKEMAATPSRIPISRVNILDSRSDTTNVGYSNRKSVKKYAFKNGFVHEMESWFSKYLDANGNSNGNTLFVNIKKLRVSEEATTKTLENGKKGQSKNGWDEGVIIKIEYYFQKDSFFIPLYRFDSIIPLKGRIETYKEEFISIGLRSSLVRLLTLKPDNLLNKRNISLSDIQRSNKKEYGLSVYTDTIPKKGLYKTFIDFKNGNVSFTDFELRNGKAGDIIYVKENDESYPLRNIWGYCDGSNFYINSGDKYSKLIREGSTFYFEGTKSWIMLIGIGGGSTTLNAPTYYGSASTQSTGNSGNAEIRAFKYYQLDMENGNIY